MCIRDRDDTPKYGLSVTGFVDPRKFWKNFGAQTGDVYKRQPGRIT